MQHSINTFTELNTDSHPVNTKHTVMTDAINATLTTQGENQLILQNMLGNEEFASLTSEGFIPLGVAVFNSIAYVVSGKFDINGVFITGEIGTFPSPDWGALLGSGVNPDPNNFLPLVQSYQPLYNFSNAAESDMIGLVPALDLDSSYTAPFRSSKLNFVPGRLIEVELQPSYDDSINIVFTDDYNSIRLVNSRFRLSDDGKSAAIAQRRQTKDTNTYSNARFEAIRLIRQSNRIADLEFLGVQTGGIMEGGNYRFYFRYTDSDGALTDVVEESGLVSIAFDDHGSRTNDISDKLVRFRLSNLDKSFSGVRVYYSLSKGESATTSIVREILNIYDFDVDDSVDITIYGSELTENINKSLLNLDYSSIGTVKSITQYNDRLLLGNITNKTKDYQKLKELSEGLKVVEQNMDLDIKELGTGYADPDNVYHNLGYWAGETYEIGIVYILKHGEGLTPVFPIRGGDNYDNNFYYSGSSPITNSSGFSTFNPSENRHGAYRFNKCRVKLKNSVSTEVRYFKVNMHSVKLDPYVIANTDGFFFVRKERKKDAIVQGYICNAYFEPAQKGIRIDGNLELGNGTILNTSQDVWAASRATAADIWNGLGVRGSGDENLVYDHAHAFEHRIGDCKVLPCPGRALDITRLFNLSDSKPLTHTIQGAVRGLSMDPNPPKENLQEIVKFWSFYSSDQLVDPQLFASIFNNESKGIVADWSAINMKSVLPGTNYVYGSWNVYSYNDFLTPYTDISNINPNNWPFVIEIYTPGGVFNLLSPSYYTFSEDLIDPNILNGLIKVRIVGVDPAIIDEKIKYEEVPVQVNITDPNAVTITFTLPPKVGTAISLPVGVTFNGVMGASNPPLIPTGTSWVDADNSLGVGGVMTAPHWRDFDFPTPTAMSVTKNSDSSVYAANITLKWKNSSWDKSPFVPTTFQSDSIRVVKSCYLTDHSFCPEEMTPAADIEVGHVERQNFMNYVLTEQDAYSDKQFASRADRNLYYLHLDSSGNAFGYSTSSTDDDDVTTTNPGPGLYSQLWQNNSDFEDYVGIRMTIGEPKLLYALQNDWNGIAANIYGIDATRMVERWTVEGVRFAVQANIYNSAGGYIRQVEWVIKYGHSSNNESYHPITKRYKWGDLVATDFINIFGGDCFLAYTYKRTQKPLGIPGLPTATDWTSYNISNRAAGLVEYGLVFPMVLESNYNTALRCFEKKDEAESLLHGKDRSFYPLDDIDELRTSRQPEAKNYNHGYSFLTSDKKHILLNDRAPSLNINFGNRIMVSAPAVGGNFFNGYTDFSGLNFRDYNKQLGEITKIISQGDSAYCIFESGIGVIPVNQRTMVTEQTGGIFLDDAQVLAEKMQIISSEYGSGQQFGIIKSDSHVYGVDLVKNKIWRITSQAGAHALEIISDFAIQVILGNYKDRVTNNNLPILVKANYDREQNNVIFSFFNELNGTFNTDLYETIEVGPTDNPDNPDTGDSIVVVDNATSADVHKSLSVSENPSVTAKDGVVYVPNQDGIFVPANQKTPHGKPITQLWEKNQLGSVYWNETLSKWVSRLSWNPLWTFNLASSLFSFNGVANQEKIWKHFSENVPHCHFYGIQDKFVFEFIIVDNASAQKILNNLHVISNRSLPGRITYGLLEDDVDYETFQGIDNGYTEFMKERHETNQSTLLLNNSFDLWSNSNPTTFLVGGNTYFTMTSTSGDNISKEESERIVGGYVIYLGIIYIIGSSYENNGIFYNEILDQNGINVLGSLPFGWSFTTIDFGIIQQNMEYIEDHLYIEVGRDESKSRIRDKAIRVRIMYEGYDYVTVQSIISTFVYSFG